jgi:uncharacterized alkaline shock family protein YloU
MAGTPMSGRSLVTRRAVADVVRRAAAGSYGVVAVSGPRPWHNVLAWIGRATPGVRVRLGPPLSVDLYLSVARGVPIAEVARNVDSAVRYRVRQALGREVDELAIHVDRLRNPVSPATDGSQPLDGREVAAPTPDAEPPPVEAGPEAA